MHIILGGTGRVGSATARALLRRGEAATVVTRRAEQGARLERAGARIAVADIRDVDALRAVFRTGRRAFLLNPTADPSGDADAEERATVAAIVEALDGSGLEKVVAQSTYGARSGERCGDLTVLHELEEKLRAQPIPAAINRGAYYMSNWTGMLEMAREAGALPSFFPADLPIAMVAPDDLGEAAARRLTAPATDVGVAHVEGPRPYTPQDVADVFSRVLRRAVALAPVPRDALVETFAQLGFSEATALSYACMTGVVLDGGIETPESPERGATTLEAFVRAVATGEAR